MAYPARGIALPYLPIALSPCPVPHKAHPQPAFNISQINPGLPFACFLSNVNDWQEPA